MRRSNDAPGNKGAPDELVEAKERLNVAARTPPVGMVGACSEHSAHARRGARGEPCSGAWRAGTWPLHRGRNSVLKWSVAGAAKLIAPRLRMFQARAMNEPNGTCRRTRLRAVRARTRDAQAACTSCIERRRLGEPGEHHARRRSPGLRAHAFVQPAGDLWQPFHARAARGAHPQARLGGAACSSPH